eukprot:763639-Hanusia_phi.AAC.2
MVHKEFFRGVEVNSCICSELYKNGRRRGGGECREKQTRKRLEEERRRGERREERGEEGIFQRHEG